jgi:hypothetical protein
LEETDRTPRQLTGHHDDKCLGCFGEFLAGPTH